MDYRDKIEEPFNTWLFGILVAVIILLFTCFVLWLVQ